MKLLLLLSTTLLLISCVPEATVVGNPTAESSTTPATVTPTPVVTDPIDDTYGKVPFYTFQSLIAHGGNATSVIWSSATSVTPAIDDQNIFRTDAILKFRVIAKPSPGKGTDSMGVACTYYAMNYSTLRLKIGVRTRTASTYSDIREFMDLQLYQPSEVVTFRPPVTGDSFVVDVLGPQWDWYKVNYPDRGYPDWVPVFDNDCIEFEIQMVTDSTYDFN